MAQMVIWPCLKWHSLFKDGVLAYKNAYSAYSKIADDEYKHTNIQKVGVSKVFLFFLLDTLIQGHIKMI